jgi:hypothetical protein
VPSVLRLSSRTFPAALVVLVPGPAAQAGGDLEPEPGLGPHRCTRPLGILALSDDRIVVLDGGAPSPGRPGTFMNFRRTRGESFQWAMSRFPLSSPPPGACLASPGQGILFLGDSGDVFHSCRMEPGGGFRMLAPFLHAHEDGHRLCSIDTL